MIFRKDLFSLLVVLVVSPLAIDPRVAQSDEPNAASGNLAKRIQPLVDDYIDGQQGDVGVMIKNLAGDGEFEFDSDTAMGTASLIKLPLMVVAHRMMDEGQLSADKMVQLSDEDKVPGSGILTTHFSEGAQFTLRDAIRLMICYSDNTATNLVIDQVGLRHANDQFESLGFKDTRLNAKVYRRDTSVDIEGSRRYGLGSTSAREMVSLLTRLYQGEIASKNSCQSMIDHLLTCSNEVTMAAGLPSGTKIAHKTGGVTKIRTDAGIVYGPKPDQAFAICVLTSNNRDTRWNAESRPHRLIAEIALQAYDTFYSSERSDTSGAPGSRRALRSGDFGKIVESLQRTLNKRMSPSPDLSIDGDFGPMTESAVKRFQQQHQLKPTGVVDANTFSHLGTLIERDDPVPSPLEIEQSLPVPAESDSLDGVPYVTAKSWVIVNANDGALVSGKEQGIERPMASTTKLMTAMVIAKLAQSDASIWDQIVTFSKNADSTTGSTAGVREGESLSAGQLVYGLMLPSGNDASVAFAEHFGGQADLISRAFPDLNSTEESGYDRFIEAMNHVAGKLGMTQSQFRNPHGLTEEGHYSTASDLAKLAQLATQDPVIRKVVQTPQYGVTVTGASGYLRNLAWYNTNRLLKIQGYEGVKTGTTSAAGACLISKGTRDGKSLIVVVLGSSCSDARYTDTRNLFRWGWSQIAQ